MPSVARWDDIEDAAWGLWDRGKAAVDGDSTALVAAAMALLDRGELNGEELARLVSETAVVEAPFVLERIVIQRAFDVEVATRIVVSLSASPIWWDGQAVLAGGGNVARAAAGVLALVAPGPSGPIGIEPAMDRDDLVDDVERLADGEAHQPGIVLRLAASWDGTVVELADTIDRILEHGGGERGRRDANEPCETVGTIAA